MEAFSANPKSEQIWLAAVKLEWENSEFWYFLENTFSYFQENRKIGNFGILFFF
jgi:hypothetical protein